MSRSSAALVEHVRLCAVRQIEWDAVMEQAGPELSLPMPGCARADGGADVHASVRDSIFGPAIVQLSGGVSHYCISTRFREIPGSGSMGKGQSEGTVVYSSFKQHRVRFGRTGSRCGHGRSMERRAAGVARIATFIDFI
jgi:hypothetical protein